MKAKLITLTCFAISILLSGCKTTFTNLTPVRVPQNPSGIYTISFASKLNNADVDMGSLEAHIAIDGEIHPMVPNARGNNIFEYDYIMPSNRNDAKYYFILNYLTDVNGVEREKETYSETYTFKLTNRYIVTIQSDRGPVGASIPVLGRGFSRFDRITVGNSEAETYYASSVALNFIVPPLPANQAYPVTLITGSGNIPIGDFRIDASSINVTPTRVNVEEGRKTVLLFSVKQEAPAGGLLIDITTDIPDSVIMPEVIIPAGSRTVRIPLEGGIPGEGHLFITAPGFEESRIPIRINPSSAAPALINPNLPTNTSTSESYNIIEAANDLIIQE